MRLFDTHAHLDDPAFDGDREAVLASLPAAGLVKLVNVGANRASSHTSLALARKTDWIYAAVGIHPEDAQEADEEGLADIANLLTQDKVVALGEIGLDYHFPPVDKPLQRETFLSQWALAGDKPVIFHIRDAWGDFLPLLKARPTRGIAHCFSGSKESARACLDAGLHIAFGGAVTFKNAARLREVAVYVPSDRLLVETDCPYMTPEPCRGKRNDPSFIAHTARFLARLRGVDEETLAEKTLENACALYGLEADE